MTLSAINSPAQTYANKMFAGSLDVTSRFEDYSGSTALAPPLPLENNSLTQNVLQTLQNLGIKSIDLAQEDGTVQNLSEETNQALQSFVQNLYKALTPPPMFSATGLESPTLAFSNSLSSGNNIIESLQSTLTQVSGGTNFHYNVDLSEADLGDYLPQVRENIKTALDNIGKYISSTVTFDVKVLTQNTKENTLAEASTTMITGTNNGKETIDSSFVSDSIYGVELSPNSPDSRLYINVDRLNEMSFDGKPTADKFDLTSILTHEILHGIAFTGLIDSGSELKTGFDELISMTNGTPIFVGRHAQTANNGRPVPLSPQSSGIGSAFYHIAMPNDLMSESIKKGEIKTISALDVAMLQDMGVSVTGISPNSPVLKTQINTYNSTPQSPSDAVKNLLHSMQLSQDLQSDFDHLVSSLGITDETSDVTLNNFLTQLAINTQELPPLQNTGSLISVSA